MVYARTIIRPKEWDKQYSLVFLDENESPRGCPRGVNG